MASQQKVKLREGRITLPIHGYREDAQPDIFQKLRRWPVRYPYPRNDLIERVKRPRVYRALSLENEYLKLTVLPGLGGHVYSATDKINNREILYRASQLKPTPLAQRGAWGPLGLEFNFPSSHSPTTLSPVSCALRRNPDGSATIVVGDVERVSRMRWSVDITLRPGMHAIETVTTLHNRTAFLHGYDYWANAAIPVGDGTRYVVPITRALGHGLPGSGDGWPVRNGVDLSWHRNIRRTLGIFGQDCREDFFGAYDLEHDWGLVHVADHRVVPGKKMFDWGAGPGGRHKSTEYSPPDGPYAEIQAGLFENQPSYETLEPHRALRFSELWCPVHGLHVPFSRANAEAAVSLEVEPGKGVHVAVNVTRPRRRCQIVLRRNGRDVLNIHRRLSPERPFARMVKLNRRLLRDADFEFLVLSPDGDVLISDWISTRKRPLGASNGRPSRKSRRNGPSDATVETHFLKGLRYEKMGLRHRARRTYERVLEEDADFAPARVHLGVMCLRGGEPQAAVQHLSRAVARNPGMAEAHYYLGLAHANMGSDAQAEDALWTAFRKGAGDACCSIEIGLAAMRRADFTEAVERFSKALTVGPHDARAAGMLSASLRHLARPRDALERLQPMAFRFPTDYLLASEMRSVTGALKDKHKARRARDAFRRLMGRNPEAYLELATDYWSAGLFEDALWVLKRGIVATSSRGEPYPMLCYYLGWTLEKLGRRREAKQQYRRGSRAKVEVCFAGRLEAIAVLERVLELYPDDAKAAAYLAPLLYHRTRRQDATRLWRRAQRATKDSGVYFTLLALAAWEADDAKSTVTWLRRASRLEPHNVRLTLWLDDALAASRQDEVRLRLLKKTFADYPENGDVREHYASLMIDMNRPERSLEILSGHRFRSRHGIFSLTRLHVNAHTAIAERLMTRKKHGDALEHLEEARRIPVSLGEDETSAGFFGKTYYLSGLCLEKLDQPRQARDCYRRCVGERRHWLWELNYYDYLSNMRLGRTRAAQESLARLGRAIDRLEGAGDESRAFVHYLRSLYLSGRGRRRESATEMRRARRLGWRRSDALQFAFKFGFS